MDDRPDEPEETEDMRDFRHRHTERRFFCDSLEYDVTQSEVLVSRANGDPFARRTLVRAIFAQVEGLWAEAIDWARYYASDDSVHRERYSAPERAVLRGEVATVSDQGEARIQEARYIPTRANLRFALSLIGRGAEELPPIDYSDGGWEALIAGFAVRDRLMHPKRPPDVDVSDVDLRQVRRGREWFLGHVRAREAALQTTLGKQLGTLFREYQQREADAQRKA